MSSSSLVHRFAAALRAPARAVALFVHGERQLVELRELASRTKETTDALASSSRRVEARLEKQGERLATLEEEIHQLQRELSERLLQYNLQLGRLARAIQQSVPAEDTDRARRLAGRPIPLSMEARDPQWESVSGGSFPPDTKGEEWLSLDGCPLCGHTERTLVLEWNKLIMLVKAPDQQSARYDYSACHACGVVYAARRPIGRRFLFLLEHFGEVTGKAAADGIIPNPLLNPYPLSDADKDNLRRMASHGVWVSEHRGLRSTEYIEGALKDRFENSVHVDLLGNLVKPAGARVLEVRPRAGTIAESLRRLYKADVSVMPMWESQGFLLKELYGFESKGVIDYDHFHIPFDGRFDLIVCNHILTHAVRPRDFLREVRSHLKPDGYLYLYNEPEDRQFLTEGKSIIAHLNPLHMQTFDQSGLMRALAANGFEVTFIKGRNSSHMVLARAAEGDVSWTAISRAKLAARIEKYRLARDRAILKLPADVRQRVGGEWGSAIEHGLAAGALDFDEKGQLRFAVD